MRKRRGEVTSVVLGIVCLFTLFQGAMSISKKIAGLPSYLLPDGRTIGPELEAQINDARDIVLSLARYQGAGSTAKARRAYVEYETPGSTLKSREADMELIMRAPRWANPAIQELADEYAPLLIAAFSDLTFPQTEASFGSVKLPLSP